MTDKPRGRRRPLPSPTTSTPAHPAARPQPSYALGLLAISLSVPALMVAFALDWQGLIAPCVAAVAIAMLVFGTIDLIRQRARANRDNTSNR